MQEGLVNAYKESGFLPEWGSPGHRDIMVGNNSASVVADAYLKGVRGYDIETLWEALKHGANSVHPKVSASGRRGYEYYNKYSKKINWPWGQKSLTCGYSYSHRLCFLRRLPADL